MKDVTEKKKQTNRTNGEKMNVKCKDKMMEWKKTKKKYVLWIKEKVHSAHTQLSNTYTRRTDRTKTYSLYV